MEENTKDIHKGFKIFIIVIIIMLIFIVNKDSRNKVLEIIQTFTVREKSLILSDSIPIEAGVEGISLYDNMIIKYKYNKLSFMKLNGDLFFEKDFNFSNPYVYVKEKNIYIADKETGDIYCVDEKGETISRIQLSESLFNLKEIQKGIIAHIKTPDGEGINILNKEGDSIRVHKVNKGNILTFASNKDSSKYILSVIDLEGILKSITKVYNIEGEELSSIEFPNEVILFSEFIDDDIITLTDKSLYYIKDDKVQWKRQFSNIMDIYKDKEEIYILYENNFEIINFEGRTLDKFVFPKSFNRILKIDKYFLIYGDNDIVIFHGHKEIAKLKSPKEILGVSGNKSVIAIHYSDSLEIYEIN